MEQPDEHETSPGQRRCGTDRDLLIERARELRRAGLSTQQIAERLGIPHNGSLARWLTGVAPPPWTARPNAKDGLRERARQLRREGRTYDEIAAALSVSKSSCSLWLRDLPRPQRQVDSARRRPRREPRPAPPGSQPAAFEAGLREVLDGRRDLRRAPADDARAARWLQSRGWSEAEISEGLGASPGSVRRWCAAQEASGADEESCDRREATRRRREVRRVLDKLDAVRAMGEVGTRDLVVAAVTAYWCEGAKDKPYERREFVTFVNSDERLIRLWWRFLDIVAVPESDRRLRIQIHESADVEEATRFWSEVTGVPVAAFQRPTLKRHTPRTNRRNTGVLYRGCLVVTVGQSARLYRLIDGAFTAVTADLLA